MALTRLLKPLWLLVAILLASSTLSKAALPSWARGMTPQQQQMVETAFFDGVTLARAVAVMFDSCDAYFNRYFASADATFVMDMIRAIADIPPNFDPADMDREAIKAFLADLRPQRLNDKFSGLSIAYENHPDIDPDHLATIPYKCTDPGVRGFIIYHKVDRSLARMSICAFTFNTYYSLQDTLQGPADLINARVPGLTCNGLGDHETDYMRTPGQTIFHELMHWPYLFMDVPDYATKIRIDQGLVPPAPQIADYLGTNPPSGYDAFYAHQVRNLPDSGGYVEALNNADSYACYAMSKTWSFLCNKYFGPAISVANYIRRGARPPQPPAKLANLEGNDTTQGVEVGCVDSNTSDWVVCY